MTRQKTSRVKISLGYINKGLYEFIPDEQVAKSNKRIKEFMTPLVKEYKNKEAASKEYIRKKILND